MATGDPIHDPMPPVCVWLKRDLRVTDHPALAEACARAQTGVVRRLPSRNGWNRLWEKRMQAVCAPLPRGTVTGGRPTIVRLTTAGILGCRDRGQAADTKDRQGGGEAAARAVLDDFLARRGRSYSGGISSPLSAPTSCSRLRPFLAWGAISMRTVWQASAVRRREVSAALAAAAHPRERAERRAWQRSLRPVQSRLHWHRHFMQKLEDEPAIDFHNMLRAADGRRENEVSADHLAAWQAGRTTQAPEPRRKLPFLATDEGRSD